MYDMIHYPNSLYMYYDSILLFLKTFILPIVAQLSDVAHGPFVEYTILEISLWQTIAR